MFCVVTKGKWIRRGEKKKDGCGKFCARLGTLRETAINCILYFRLKYNYPEIFEVPKTKFRQTTKFLTKKEKILDPFIVIQVK